MAPDSNSKTRIERVDGNLVMTRVFDAPRELVFNAWTDPQSVQAWWGCAQTTSVTSTIDLRVGGEYRHLMTIEGCGEVPFVGHFLEVDPPNKLAYSVKGATHEGMPPMPDTITSVEFMDRGSQTELRLTIQGLAGTPYEEIVQGGWTAGIEKLDQLLTKGTSTVQEGGS